MSNLILNEMSNVKCHVLEVLFMLYVFEYSYEFECVSPLKTIMNSLDIESFFSYTIM